MLFHKKSKAIDTSIRSDGYRECDMSIILWFQREFESEFPDAVRCGLKAARDAQFVVTKQNLMRFINNEEWSEFGTYQ